MAQSSVIGRLMLPVDALWRKSACMLGPDRGPNPSPHSIFPGMAFEMVKLCRTHPGLTLDSP